MHKGVKDKCIIGAWRISERKGFHSSILHHCAFARRRQGIVFERFYFVPIKSGSAARMSENAVPCLLIIYFLTDILHISVSACRILSLPVQKAHDTHYKVLHLFSAMNGKAPETCHKVYHALKYYALREPSWYMHQSQISAYQAHKEELSQQSQGLCR